MVGFGGALIVIQPSFEIFGWTSLLPVACAFLYTLYLFLNRAIGDADSPLVMQTMSGIAGTVFMGAALLAGNAFGDKDFAVSLPQSGFALTLLILLGSISGYMHLLIVRAFRLAPSLCWRRSSISRSSRRRYSVMRCSQTSRRRRNGWASSLSSHPACLSSGENANRHRPICRWTGNETGR